MKLTTLAVVAASAALGIAIAVRLGSTGALDIAGLRALDAHNGPPWLAETVRDVTGLGSNGVLGLCVALLAVNAAIARRMRDASLLVGTFAGGVVLVGLIKVLVARPRPNLLEPAARVFTTSFPSSHAMLSAALVTIVVLLVRQRPYGPASAWFHLGAALLVCGAIGLSRVALGVHWPSDVLAGWALGVAWAVLCWRVAQR